jgi:RNA polymerase sigma-70 factor (ECF subfamily)
MQELIEKIKNNDRKAQEQVYKKYGDKMFLTCYRYSGNEDDAAEILNTGFYKAFKNIGSFIYYNEKAFEGWLKKIMVNEALTFLRSKKRNEISFDSDQFLSNTLSVSEDHLTDEDYYFLIQKLPEGYRVIFNLFAIEGYNHNEISELLNISESTSRSQLSRARESLRKLITQEL